MVIVVADTESDLAELYAAALERRGYETHVWRGEASPSVQADVLIADTMLPGVGELIGRFRALSPALAVISTGMHTPLRRELFRFGNAYLKKPFGLGELEAAVASVRIDG